MKPSIFKTITSLAKGIIRGKRKESVAMESYLKCIPTIQTLIDKHLLGINLKERLIVMDISVHLMFISTRLGKDMSDADKRYASFIDKVVAFMNFQLGRMGANDFVLHFHPRNAELYSRNNQKYRDSWTYSNSKSASNGRSIKR